MFRSSLSRFVCGLLVLVLTAAPLAAAEPAGRSESRAAGLAGLWSWLVELWSEHGCYIDPYGCPGVAGTPSAPAENENGCYIDPSGGCRG